MNWRKAGRELILLPRSKPHNDCASLRSKKTLDPTALMAGFPSQFRRRALART